MMNTKKNAEPLVYESKSPEDTKGIAVKLIAHLSARRGVPGSATVVSLSGELGAGKTVFMKGIAAALLLSDEITSPTYVIQKTYVLAHTQFDRLVHIDAYRLTSALELTTLGWYETLTNPRAFVCIEWPEMVASIVPLHAIEVSFSVLEETTRIITIRGLDH